MNSLFSAIFIALSFVGLVSSTPLDDYVWKSDENYKWVDLGEDHILTGSVGNRGYKGYTLNMTSQRWLTDDVFSPNSNSKSLWWHYLVVIVPDNVQYTRNASLWITGGSVTSGFPSTKDEDILVSAALATATSTVTGVLFQIPNEHTTFASDPIQKSRTEDAIIAFTWAHFLDDPSNPEWLVRFPMVKASLRAMDAVKEFTQQKLPELGTSLDYFTVAGASKRGWTTWLVAAVDPTRVMLAVPVVLDAINFVTVMHHQFRSYGGWSYALQDYIDMNITERFDEPNMLTLSQYEDPYFYFDRLTMPKLIVNAAMDEFQQPDDTHYWWKDLPAPKQFLIAPNAEHSLATGILEVVPAIGAWVQNHLLKEAVPSMTWTIDGTTGEIVATIGNEGVVYEANLWWAYSCGQNAFDGNTNRRDYRVAHLDNPCACGIYAEGYCANLKSIWNKQKLDVEMVRGKRTYRAKLDAPDDGRWVAFFIDVKFVNKHSYPVDLQAWKKSMDIKPTTPASKIAVEFDRYFDNFGGFPHDFGRFFEYTTEVSIMPNVFPYPDCSGVECGTRAV